MFSSIVLQFTFKSFSYWTHGWEMGYFMICNLCLTVWIKLFFCSIFLLDFCPKSELTQSREKSFLFCHKLFKNSYFSLFFDNFFLEFLQNYFQFIDFRYPSEMSLPLRYWMRCPSLWYMGLLVFLINKYSLNAIKIM